MSRKQQILKAYQKCGTLQDHYGRSCFVKGANWADRNPEHRWHRFPDEKPTEGRYLVYYSEGIGIAKYTRINLGEKYGFVIEGIGVIPNIYAYRELPQPPKFN